MWLAALLLLLLQHCAPAHAFDPDVPALRRLELRRAGAYRTAVHESLSAAGGKRTLQRHFEWHFRRVLQSAAGGEGGGEAAAAVVAATSDDGMCDTVTMRRYYPTVAINASGAELEVQQEAGRVRYEVTMCANLAANSACSGLKRDSYAGVCETLWKEHYASVRPAGAGGAPYAVARILLPYACGCALSTRRDAPREHWDT